MTAEVAWRLFIERGYDTVTVQDICAAADIAPRTFHRYFAGKEDVVMEPRRRMGEVVREAISSAPAQLTDTATMRLALLALGRFAIEHRDLLTALRIVALRSQHLAAGQLGVRPEEDSALADQLAARRPGGDRATDWRLRLLVACFIAGFRIWFDDFLQHPLTDPLAHLEQVLAAVEQGTAQVTACGS